MKSISKTLAVGLALAGLFLTGRNAHSQYVQGAKATEFCEGSREELTETRTHCPPARGLGIGPGAREIGASCVIDRNVLRRAVRCLETIHKLAEDQNQSDDTPERQEFMPMDADF